MSPTRTTVLLPERLRILLIDAFRRIISIVAAKIPGPARKPVKNFLLAALGPALVAKLESFRNSAAVADAAWGLAKRHIGAGDYDRALDQLDKRRSAQPRTRDEPEHLALEVEALLRLGRLADAQRVIKSALARVGTIPELCFGAANAAALQVNLSKSDRDQIRLDWLNKPFRAAGIPTLELKDKANPLALDNIKVATTKPHPRSGEAKVSVLLPAYNAEDTIAIAIESVLNQTWTNIELIIVDDGSIDDTWRVVESLAARDSRVVALRHDQNRGAYPARNTALKHVSGDFVTVNDADDWSHPERIALQVLDLLDWDGAFNTTNFVRVKPDLRIHVRPRGAMLLECFTSLIARTDAVVALGGWDESRFGADDEFYQRLIVKSRATRKILHPEVPLSLATLHEESLTTLPDIGLTTIAYGARREYMEAYYHWHQLELKKPQPDLAMRSGERRFPAPHICRSGEHRVLTYDLLLVSDFSLSGGTAADNIDMLRASADIGLSCACLHWPRFDLRHKKTSPRIRQLLHEGVADSVVPGEHVCCPLVIVNHPPILNMIPDRLLDVRTEHCVIAVDQVPMTRAESGAVAFDVGQVVDNARKAFGVAPTLAPASAVIRRVLGNDGRADLTPTDWTPVVDTMGFRRTRASWDSARPPVVGRHGRDTEDQWPSDPQSLRDAYCADTSWDVRIFGGAEVAKRILGELPANWAVEPFDSLEVTAFLASLDVAVHYPHEHLLDACPRAVLEAMAASVPAIVPPSFEETFGDAVIYAEPAEVPRMIERLWADKGTYEAQVARALAFVEANCSFRRFEERVRAYLAPTHPRDSGEQFAVDSDALKR